MPKESIVDASVPSASRIYDYILGGHHNFEVDRKAAQYILSSFPFVAKMLRLQRWCLQDIGHELTYVRGFDTIIDFASGLPTQDHLHTVVKPGTTVIYSDYDPVVVEYAREILGDTPNVYFFEADARRPEELLNRPEVGRLLNGNRNVALVYWGVTVFFSDEEVQTAARKLHQWAGDSACWAFNAQGAGFSTNHPASAAILEMYERMGTPLQFRTQESYVQLVKPWQSDEFGYVSLLDWHGLDFSEMTDEDRKIFGPTGAGYGAYLVK